MHQIAVIILFYAATNGLELQLTTSPWTEPLRQAQEKDGDSGH